MTRVMLKRLRGQVYPQVLADYRTPQGWRQRVVASFGRLSPESHARAIIAAALLDRLDVELRRDPASTDPLRLAVEAEISKIVSPEAIAQLKRTIPVKAVA